MSLKPGERYAFKFRVREQKSQPRFNYQYYSCLLTSLEPSGVFSDPSKAHQTADLKHIDYQIFIHPPQKKRIYLGSAENYNLQSTTMLS